jgi:hypothetical protein
MSSAVTALTAVVFSSTEAAAAEVIVTCSLTLPTVIASARVSARLPSLALTVTS